MDLQHHPPTDATATPTAEDRPAMRTLVAAALTAHPTDAILRRDLRTLLPPGHRIMARARTRERVPGNSTVKAMGNVLREFSRAGWVERDGDEWVIIRDRVALSEVAAGLRPPAPRAAAGEGP